MRNAHKLGTLNSTNFKNWVWNSNSSSLDAKFPLSGEAIEESDLEDSGTILPKFEPSKQLTLPGSVSLSIKGNSKYLPPRVGVRRNEYIYKAHKTVLTCGKGTITTLQILST